MLDDLVELLGGILHGAERSDSPTDRRDLVPQSLHGLADHVRLARITTGSYLVADELLQFIG
jgi:hypothetical protein